MKRTLVFLWLLVSCAVSIAQTADTLKSPRVWLRADINDSPSGWTDVSFYRNDATSSVSDQLPSLEGTINFNRAFVFDGIDDYLKIPYSLEAQTELTILSVFESADTTERGVFGSEETSSRMVLLTTRRAIGPDTITDRYGKFERMALLSSLVQNWESAKEESPTAHMALGSAGLSRSYKPFRGNVAEIIVFDHALSFLDRIQYETYLAIKYGTGLNGGNFISSAEQVLWKVDENKAYGHHIAGIGRDDFFKLHQKQSGSTYDSGLLIMSVGPLAPSNAANIQSIPNENFILWGDNGMPLAQKRGEGADSILSYIQRKWLLTATGALANKTPVEFQIDASRFPADPRGYWLVIDRSGQGNFSVDNLEYKKADEVRNGKLVFRNLLWDTDGSGKDHFGFVKAVDLLAVVRKLNDPSCTDATAGRVAVEVVAGAGPYQVSLSSADAKIQRNWKQTSPSYEQKELGAGQYTLTLADADKDRIERTFTLVMPDALTIDLGPDQSIAETPSISLDVSSQVPSDVQVAYRWESSFGFRSEETKITVTESGIYKVFVAKQSDGCVFSDVVTISGGELHRVAVFPTILRTNENYNVGISMEEPASVGVRILNASGLEIQSMKGSGQSEYQFVVSHKDPGMYLIVIRTPKGVDTRKVVVH